ncbi:MAG TPA: methionyl-tRNA formyltransferase [Solirubrobacteraceae bacterium]
MRTVFLGTAQFAVPVLERLARSEHRPVLVITRPDRPRGRGRRVAPPPVAQAAAQLGIEVAQPPSVNDRESLERITTAAPEVVCVCAFGGLIKEPLLSTYPMLNVHPSLLPRWRGAAPIERAIIAGDERTGVSIMRVAAGLDSGPVCAESDEAVAPDDTYGTLAPRLADAGGELLVSTLTESPPCAEQDEALATYAEKIGPEDRRLDPSRPALELERVVRALTPHIGAQLLLDDGPPLGVARARALDTGPPAGELCLDGPLPVLGCGEGALELLVVKPPGRREMSAEDWLRGLR